MSRVPMWSLGMVLLAVAGAAASGRTPVADVVKRGDFTALRAVLRQHAAEVNTPEPDGMTALHWAARMDAVEATDLLLRSGAAADATTRYGVTPLSLAATNGGAAIVERLLAAGADANRSSEDGETILMTAVKSGSVRTVKALLTHGARINAAESWRGQTALMWAAAARRTAVVEALLEAGADMTRRSYSGFSPFLFAVREGDLDTVEVLLKAGARLDDTLPDGTSPLALAIINGHMPLALRLLERGADPKAPDPRGSILHALTWVRTPGYPQTNATFFHLAPPDDDSLAVAKALLDRGADPNVRIAWKEVPLDRDLGIVKAPPNIAIARNYLTFFGATPFWLAAKHSDVRLMRLLVARGANPRTPSRHNVTPLMVAAGLGFWDAESPAPANGIPESQTLEAVTLTWELGGDVNETTDFGNLPLEGEGQELRHRHPANLERLQADYPDLMLGDMRWGGATALHGAGLRGVSSVVKFLVDKGAKIDAKTKYGWTPYQMAEGVFASNAERVQPATAEFIAQLLKERGLWDAEIAGNKSAAEAISIGK